VVQGLDLGFLLFSFGDWALSLHIHTIAYASLHESFRFDGVPRRTSCEITTELLPNYY
jgi:hypothetical protein